MKTGFTAFLVVVAVAAAPALQGRALTAALPDDAATVTHVLNRLAFGPQPGEVERVRQLGLAKWVDQQLHPAQIEDSSAEARIPVLPAASPSSDPKELRQFARRQIVTLSSDKILRAAFSERQLQEVLTDFWFNHFNVYAAKGRTAQFLPEYERDVIRPHVFDHFRDLLEATSKSPAMLFYLDNWLNASASADQQLQRFADQRRRRARLFGAPNPPPQAPPSPQNRKRTRGPNENYGRELLELHTLGVDGGYTQQDVVDVARAFTGWTIDRNGAFRFVPMLHDNGTKVVLGHTINAGGIADGEKVLDIVASHPATAHHIALELAQRLVADQPPATLVDRAAARFRETNGDLREVVRTIVTSPEFLAPAARNTKFKTPFELVVSAIRESGADVKDGRPFVPVLRELGEPLYLCQPPTGYDDTADAWISAGGLVSRINFATRFAAGRMPGVTLPGLQAPDLSLRDGAGAGTNNGSIAANSAAPSQLATKLGSPEFQRH